MKLTLYILGLFFLSGCGHGYEVTALYSQKIENSDKLIIAYEAWSTLNDGAKYGTTIINKNYSVEVRLAEQMPFDFLIGSPKNDTLFVIQLKESSTKQPKYLSTDISNFKGLTIKKDIYNYESGSSYNLTCRFSNFRETKDSIIILGIEDDCLNIQANKMEIGFLKGNIKLIESKALKGIIKQIEIPAFLSKKSNNNSLDKITVIRNDSLKIDGLVYFTFEPTREIKTREFTNFGIYKKREINDPKSIQ
jgi:hypothetical protein